MLVQTRDEAAKQLEESKKTGEAQWTAAQKQYQKATPANQKASTKTWNLAQKARDEVGQSISSRQIFLYVVQSQLGVLRTVNCSCCMHFDNTIKAQSFLPKVYAVCSLKYFWTAGNTAVHMADAGQQETQPSREGAGQGL